MTTALTSSPKNTSYLQASKFLLAFDRIPNTQYFCQTANIPGVNIGQAQISSPLLDYFAPGNKITYNPFNITFAVNGDASSWSDLHNWFRAIASPESFDERNRLTAMATNKRNLQSYSDATLTVLSNLNNPVLRVRFINMFPITLSDILFDTRETADDILIADASFMFEYFNFEAA